jgi:hypothetical protein
MGRDYLAISIEATATLLITQGENLNDHKDISRLESTDPHRTLVFYLNILGDCIHRPIQPPHIFMMQKFIV